MAPSFTSHTLSGLPTFSHPSSDLPSKSEIHSPSAATPCVIGHNVSNVDVSIVTVNTKQRIALLRMGQTPKLVMLVEVYCREPRVLRTLSPSHSSNRAGQ